MLIEVRGVGFVNKGAELMLHAIIEKTRDVLREPCICMAPSGGRDYVNRATLGLYQKVRLEKCGVSLGDLLPESRRRRYRQLYGLVCDRDLDVVLDASGFLYSDQWGDAPAIAMASLVRRWKRRGTCVVLLPQAMGPFTSAGLRDAFAYVASNADIVFPRDRISYQHVVDLVGERENIQQSPDFTNIVAGVRPEDPTQYRGRVCLVPNCHMVDKTSEQDAVLYEYFCAECIKVLCAAGHRPFILVHGGQDDEQLAERIVGESQEEIDIVIEANPLKVKGILGLCRAVIGSRFHSLVSAMSQGVPALASGWSHKYQMLFDEYGMPEGCVPVTIARDALRTKIERLTGDGSHRASSARIAKAAKDHMEQTESMWRRVFDVIGESGHGNGDVGTGSR
jgi:colanic acid/amylovoran biosynthesis protein